jgi:hypothetical protein
VQEYYHRQGDLPVQGLAATPCIVTLQSVKRFAVSAVDTLAIALPAVVAVIALA